MMLATADPGRAGVLSAEPGAGPAAAMTIWAVVAPLACGYRPSGMVPEFNGGTRACHGKDQHAG